MPGIEQSAAAGSLPPDFNSPALLRYRHWRHVRDIVTRYLMVLGGISVIIAIVLIAFYLLYVVLPLFRPARIETLAQYPLPGPATEKTGYYAMEEQHEIGLRMTTTGKAIFFKTASGEVLSEHDLLAGSGGSLSVMAAGDPDQSLLALGLTDGRVLLVQAEYQVAYPDDTRLITPVITYPYGPEPVPVVANGNSITRLSAQYDGEEATIAAVTSDARLYLLNLAREESFLTGEVEISRTASEIPLQQNTTHLILDVDQRELYLADQAGFISYFDVSDKSSVRQIQRVHAVPEGDTITSLAFLSGGISVLVGDNRGRITQWFPIRDDNNNFTLGRIRHFQSQRAPITGIAPEYYRKGFIAIDEDGQAGIYHTTAQRTVKLEKIGAKALTQLAVAPRANAMLVEDQAHELHFLRIHNEHPEISWSSIWGKVWYESRAGPEYIWQSSSASNDFEPKFSLTPLAFGTLKAAFYAMLFAIPLAIMGAIYTAYFMVPRMRNMVKPTIEIMAALPTVILGFIAGLWFAPVVETYLPGMLLILVLVPAAILAASWAWQYMPALVQSGVADGWEAALLLPIIILAITVSIWISQPVELWLFDGNMPMWLTRKFGISYDQRNSLVVGIAIGFAVIPTIFSISEDAVFGVPKSLTTGSLALGATSWQTMMRVILLTASPGIFSAVMIGLGRAVGETMIVVMATGNTAIMDMNIFQGFRALSANIAVEMPEAEVAGTHYRILFLAGLVLFLATFIFNTVAEIVRQRLRTKYSTL